MNILAAKRFLVTAVLSYSNILGSSSLQAESGEYFRSVVENPMTSERQVWILHIKRETETLHVRFFSSSRDLDSMDFQKLSETTWKKIGRRVGRIYGRDTVTIPVRDYSSQLTFDSAGGTWTEVYDVNSLGKAWSITTIYQPLASKKWWGKTCVMNNRNRDIVEIVPMNTDQFVLFVPSRQELFPEVYQEGPFGQIVISGLFNGEARGEGALTDAGLDLLLSGKPLSCRWGN